MLPPLLRLARRGGNGPGRAGRGARRRRAERARRADPACSSRPRSTAASAKRPDRRDRAGCGRAVRAVVFDLWETLVDWPRAESGSSGAAGRSCSVSPSSDSTSSGTTSPPTDLRERPLAPAGGSQLCAAVGSDADVEELIRSRRELTRRALVPREGVVETLAELRRLGLRLGLITNCTEDVVDVWADGPLAHSFDACVFSCSVGCEARARGSTRSRPTRSASHRPDCLFVGDGANDELRRSRSRRDDLCSRPPPGRGAPLGRAGRLGGAEDHVDRAGGRAGARVVTLEQRAVPDVLGPGLDVVFCGINPGRASAARVPLRQPTQRLLAAAPRRRLHAAALWTGRAARTPRSEHRRDQRGPPDDARLGGSPPRRLRRGRGAARAACAGPSPTRDRVRRQGGLSRNVRGAPSSWSAGAPPRRHAAVRAAVDVAGQRGRAVGGAA